MLRAALFWLACAAAFAVLWLWAIGVVTRVELVAACLGGAAAATLMLAIRGTGELAFRPEPPAPIEFVRIPWTILRDSVVVLLAIPRRPRGRWSEAPARADSAWRRAVEEWSGSLAPNAFVANVDSTRRVAERHDLVP